MDRKRIEDLSNLVFGLALTLGAITLTKPDNDDLVSLFNTIIQFGLSFAVIIWIWWLYNNLVHTQNLARRGMVPFNLLLLFLVVIEPFLLSISQPYASGRIAYSIDLGLTLVIFAIFTHSILTYDSEGATPAQKKNLKSNRDLTLVCAAIFFTSLIPQSLWGDSGVQVQSLMWLSALFIGVVGRGLRSVRSD